MDCPLLEKKVSYCDEYLNVSHVDHALRACADNYLNCPVYERYERELAAKDAAAFRRKNRVA